MDSAPRRAEKLAKVSGILLAHPASGWRWKTHGRVGGTSTTSASPSSAPRQFAIYLVQNGIQMNNISARGFGKTRPLVSNDTPPAGSKTARVELVVSATRSATTHVVNQPVLRP